MLKENPNGNTQQRMNWAQQWCH